jgi:UDP-N-acetylmuramoylalanine--D-glutamate ligase
MQRIFEVVMKKRAKHMQTNKLKVVIGLGKTGLSCVRYLIKQGFDVAMVDSRIDPPCLAEFQKEFPQMLSHFGDFAAPFLDQAAELIISPGVSLKEPAIAALVAKGVRPIGDIELFARAARAPVVAITGANGKSTVTSLVGEMAQASGVNVRVGGNLGMPALDLLDDTARLYVMELSSFQLETTYSLAPAASVILNITPDHMDRYASLDEYRAAKQRIYHDCKIAVINRDDPYTYQNAQLPKQIISFGLNAPHVGEFGIVDNYLAFGKEKLIAFDELRIKGMHQVANALAALALGHAVGLPFPAMVKALREFAGLTHRCQWVKKIDGVDWYNDSKGTNVGATKAAIEGLGASISGKVILIAGGLGKDADFTLLRDAVQKYVRTLILIGKDAPIIGKALENTTSILFADYSLENALSMAKKSARCGDAVLLSPACASFDMFKNFEHRGDVFMELVKTL